jgi:hypothetical protein
MSMSTDVGVDNFQLPQALRPLLGPLRAPISLRPLKRALSSVLEPEPS